MLPVALLYPLMILDVVGHVVPVLVALASLRRARRSTGFNRWLYLYTAAFSAATLAFLALLGWNDVTLHVAALAAAWATLPLWLCLRATLAPTSARAGAWPVATPPQPEAVAASEPALPFFTVWRMAARALQG